MLLSTSLLCNLPLISSALAAPTNEGQYGGWHSSYAKRAATCSVKTTSGNVQGHLSSIAPDVHEYLGIPYGKSTAGDLRWAAPQPFSGEGDLPGDKYGPDCPIFAVPAGPDDGTALYRYRRGSDQSNHTFSEDCLSLNVWAKPSDGHSPPKAVMVWIYGGGFTTGTTNLSVYDASTIAGDEDVIVVTLNYRTDFFGFASGPDFKDHNFGLLDQRLAVEWVRDNIAAFGGDPKRITLFGESAGGASVDMYSYAWTADPIVNGFIPQSGTVGILTGGISTALQSWYNVSEKVGCGDSSAGAATVPCMRAQSFKDLLNATTTLGLSFTPVIDDVTAFSDYPARAAAGNFIKRPMLVGNNDNEGGLWDALFGGALPPEQVAVFNNLFTCGSASAAAVRFQNSVKSWRYRYYGVWPNLAISEDAGAYHSSEIPQIFGNAARLSGVADTPEENIVGDTMRHAWAEFAKDPDNGLVTLGWPVYDPAGNTLIRIAYNNSAEISFGKSTEYDAPCGGGSSTSRRAFH